MQTAALQIDNLAVRVQTPDGPLQLVHDVSLRVSRGEALGVVGESGCGKSVSFMAALGLLGGKAEISGSVKLFGQELIGLSERELQRLRGRRLGMIFQDPQGTLNPVRTIGYQLGEPLKLHMGMDGPAVRRRAVELLNLVGIPAPETVLRAYPHQISGGMCQRVMIAMALAPDPEVLIADEPTTALDATVQMQVLRLLRDIQRNTGLALVLITHDLGVVSTACKRLSIMYAGRTVETQAIPDVFHHALHPYTSALIDCLPSLDEQAGLPASIGGEVPLPGNLPGGCAFHPRCAFAGEYCRVVSPQNKVFADGMSSVACHRPVQSRQRKTA